MASYRLILGLCCTLVVQAYTPQNIMVDVTNEFGVCVLQIVASKNENVAFSPYGLVTVALILYEGSAGPTAAEIHNSLRLPWERDVTRIGFRDLHRYLKSYFTNDGFLRGLVLSKPNVLLRTNYTKLLDFYGFDIRTGVTTVRPETTPAYVPSRAPEGPPMTTETPRSRTTPMMSTRRMMTTGKTTTIGTTTRTTTTGTITTTTPRMTTSPRTTMTQITTRPTIQTATEPPATRPVTESTTMTSMSQTNETSPTPESKIDEMDIDVQTTPPGTTVTAIEMKSSTSEIKTTTELPTTSPVTEPLATAASEIDSVTQITEIEGPGKTTTSMPSSETTVATQEMESQESITEPSTDTTTGSPSATSVKDSKIQEKVTRHERSLYSAHLEHRDGLSNWVPHYNDPRWNHPGEQWFFTYSNGESVPVLTYTAYLPFAYVPELESLALQIPLDDPRYSMVIILPEERLGLFDVLYSLQWCPLSNVLSQLKVTAVYAVVPSFTLVKHVNLRPVMTQLGIRSLFDPYRADLSTMSAEPNLFVKSIEQVVTVSLRKYYSNHRWFDATPSEVQHHFIANHPFLYFVIDRETEVTLMAGTMVNPRAHPQ